MAITNCATVKVVGVPPTSSAADLLTFLSSVVGSQAIAADIPLVRRGWLPRTTPTGEIIARVQFVDALGAEKALELFRAGKVPPFGKNRLEMSSSDDDIVPRASITTNRLEDVELLLGNRQEESSMEVIQSWSGVRIEIMPERTRIDIFLENDGLKYKLEVHFHDIISSNGCKLSTEDASDAILLELLYAPRIYCAVDIPQKNRNYRTERYCAGLQPQCIWIRQPDFTCRSSFGKSSCICLKLHQGSSYTQPLKSLPLWTEIGEIILLHIEPIMIEPVLHNVDYIELHPLLEIPSEISVPYEILFQLNSLVHMHKLPPKAVNLALLQALNKLSLEFCTKILQRMHRLNSTCYNPVQFVKSQMADIVAGNRVKSNNGLSEQRLMKCYRVLITPTKVYLQGPEAENSNYVVKHFSKYAADFARVSFVDEDWSKLPFSSISTKIEQGFLSSPIKTGIHSRILSVLKNGFRIGSKKFEFLAFSASQLRGNSVWMFASNSEVTAATIREFMGQFTSICSVSKCAARMGQLFSSSTPTINVPRWEVKSLKDIEISTDTGAKYCFSDGIGQISLSFAKQVAQKCGLAHIPSAYQIRYGGFKGVVAVNRKSFSKLSLRDSMKKFESQNTMLNITKWSDYQPAFLNREIITLLSTLGVPDEVFIELQRDHLMLLDKILTSCDSALRSVQRLHGRDLKTVVKMLMEGYEPAAEPYLFMVLKAHRAYQFVDIRTRCRISVPRARISVGCLDEVGCLEYGQVYIRVTLTKEDLMERTKELGRFHKFDGTTGVVVGKVVVTKNPCLHPGDVRVLDAVYDAALDDMGLIDCLVFPQKGKRPHPNECSGGDLDGDLYFVSWDERLIPPETDSPMDYSGPRPRIMDHAVTLEEIQNFFVDYMANDTLGAISNSHLVHSDRDPLKARSKICLELAQLHSMSVDFAKTGAPAEMPKGLTPKEYPDFMERHDKPTYISTGVLGKLYRSFMSYTCGEDVESKVACNLSYDSDLEVEGYENYLEEAKEYYKMYHEKFCGLMCYYKAEEEEEIVTGNLSNKSLYLKRDNKQYGELKDHILVAFKGLQREAESWFKNSCNESEYSKMASAWYHVVYHPNFSGIDEKRHLSFPWVNCDVLLGIKSSKRHMKKLEEHREEIMRDLYGDMAS